MNTTSWTSNGARRASNFTRSADAHIRSTLNRTWASGLLTALAGCAIVCLAPNSGAAADAAVLLHEAGTARMKWTGEQTPANGQAFVRATQAAADTFTKVELKPSGSTEQFVRVSMNQHGTLFDGIRFTVPAGEPRDLAWGLAGLPQNMPAEWYILPRAGEMQGFRTYFRGGPGMKDVPWAETVIPYQSYLQPLNGGELKPGQEYLIWFRFYDQRPKDLYVTLKLVPVGTPLNSSATVHAQLGLSYYPATQ